MATEELSQNWPVTQPINPQFSPDGQFITFAAVVNNAWNVFVWNRNAAQPVNLSQTLYPERSEDPKFAPDQQSIIF